MEYAVRTYTTSGRSGIVTKTFDDAIKCIDIYQMYNAYKIWITDSNNQVLYTDIRPYVVLRGLQLVSNGTGEKFYTDIAFHTLEEAEQCSKNCQWLTKVVEMRDACDYLGVRWYA